MRKGRKSCSMFNPNKKKQQQMQEMQRWIPHLSFHQLHLQQRLHHEWRAQTAFSLGKTLSIYNSIQVFPLFTRDWRRVMSATIPVAIMTATAAETATTMRAVQDLRQLKPFRSLALQDQQHNNQTTVDHRSHRQYPVVRRNLKQSHPQQHWRPRPRPRRYQWIFMAEPHLKEIIVQVPCRL